MPVRSGFRAFRCCGALGCSAPMRSPPSAVGEAAEVLDVDVDKVVRALLPTFRSAQMGSPLPWSPRTSRRPKRGKVPFARKK